VIEIGSSQDNAFAFPMKLLNEGASLLKICTADLVTGRPIKNAYVELWKEKF